MSCIFRGEIGEYTLSVRLLILVMMLGVEVEDVVLGWSRWWRDFGQLGEEGR